MTTGASATLEDAEGAVVVGDEGGIVVALCVEVFGAERGGDRR